MKQPIGIFDSGFGGLTVMKEIVKLLPQYDYIYLGDNARAPYGSRSFQTVYDYTLQAVQWLFKQQCPVVILACNTASAKALRNIQQNHLPNHRPERRVLGVIRPTSEVIGNYSATKKVGVLATTGTVESNSYKIEIDKFFPEVEVYQQACPLWVPLIENGEQNSEGADYFVRQDVQKLFAQNGQIDTLLLACTHYPLLLDKIKAAADRPVTIISQGEIVAKSFQHYLERHPELEQQISQQATRAFFTTDDTETFNRKASVFYASAVEAQQAELQ